MYTSISGRRNISHIAISAGQRGTQLRIETDGLISLLGCQLVDVADEAD